MTLAVRENDEETDHGRDADSRFDEDDAPADVHPSESQIEMADQQTWDIPRDGSF